MKWWEKTVEYYFIRKFIPEDMIISPLDGEQEKAGDALLSNNDKWIIIEFKKDFKSLSSEKKKYKNYEAALTDLSPYDSHHFLIYGQVHNEEFGLRGKSYFSNKPISNISEIFESGKSKAEFILYLKKLIEYKAKSDESSGGSVGSFSFVAGISQNKKITSCMNLYEFGLDHGFNLEPKLELKRERTRSRSGPSMGR